MTLTFMATGQDALHVEIGGLLRISIVSSARWFVFQPFHSDTVLIAFNVLSKKKKDARPRFQYRCRSRFN